MLLVHSLFLPIPLSEAKTDITENLGFKLVLLFNEKNIHILFFILNTNLVNAETIIAYLDVQFIMDNSKLGLKYKEELSNIKRKLILI